jgi:hypothetical protein
MVNNQKDKIMEQLKPYLLSFRVGNRNREIKIVYAENYEHAVEKLKEAMKSKYWYGDAYAKVSTAYDIENETIE